MNRFVKTSLSAAAGMALAACTGASAGAQSPAAQPQQTQQSPAAQQTSPTPPTPQKSATESQPGASEAQPQQSQRKIQMVQAQAELDTSLDAKKAKQGEPVKAKLTENVQIPDAQQLPRNTVLEGHVDQVTPSEHKSDSTVVVTFDKAKLKDGQELPIKATVIAVSEPALATAEGGGGASGGGMPAASGMPSGGGAMPQSSGGDRGSQTGTGSSAGAAPQQPTMPDANAASQQQGSGGVPDVKLTSDIHQHTSATFTSKGRNVHVPDGTQMQMAIAVIPAGVHLQ